MKLVINSAVRYREYRLVRYVLEEIMESAAIFALGFLLLSTSVHNINCFPSPTTSSPSSDVSFKRLESGENSDEMTNQCCVREPKFVTIGYGLDSDELRVDVGYCRQTCHTTRIKPLKRDEFDKYLKKYPDIDPIQIFLSLQHQHAQNGNQNNGNGNGNGNGGGDRFILPIHSGRGSGSGSSSNRNTGAGAGLAALTAAGDGAPGTVAPITPPFRLTTKSTTASCISSLCSPTMMRREKHFTLAGGFQQNNVDIIESCDCIIPPTTCQRTPLKITMHPATPYERVIDIGQCGGPCPGHNDRPNCKPVRNQSVTIDGPNGQECIETIQECQCVGECFRAREFLKVYDYTVMVDESVPVDPTNTTSLDDDVLVGDETVETVQLLKEPVLKVIDIGRCGGTCDNTHVTTKCLLRSSDNSTCLSSLYGGQNQCIPTKFLSHYYTDKIGHRHSVFSILACGCR